jgi:thioredoxin reductase (NADPH)
VQLGEFAFPGFLCAYVPPLLRPGFAVTGADVTEGASASRRAVLPLETSRLGVFAIGDVRAGSTIRVASVVGEGAAVVAQIHSALVTEP